MVGVSPDSVESHKGFRQSRGIRIALLSDPDKKVAEKYGAYGEKKMYGKTTKGIIRSTAVIDDSGKVTKFYTNVKSKGHAEKVLEEL